MAEASASASASASATASGSSTAEKAAGAAASQRLDCTATHTMRDPQRFEKARKVEADRIAPYEGPKVVTHTVPTNEASKSGQVGSPNHRGISRNGLGGFFAA